MKITANQSVSNLFAAFVTFFLLHHASANKCRRQTCHGDVGNLAAGRQIDVSSWCGEALEDQFFLTTLDGCRNNTDHFICSTGDHPPLHMTDSAFTTPNSWWQSKSLQPGEKVELRFDLETSFYFTHLVMVFHSVRPGAMTLERSVDNGNTWQIYKYFANNCTEIFGIDDDDNDFRSLCTSAYSHPEPCTRGEVIYRVLDPTKPAKDPYSARLQHLLKITNLRIKLWNPQQCGECGPEGFQYFSIYDVIIRGTCFCNGHADSCVPFEQGVMEPHDRSRSVVHGKCLCEHHTAGEHCGVCAPLYNDAPWKPANGITGEANACKKCNCHGHATACSFDVGVWRETGGRSGGICTDCLHNTAGRNCDKCAHGFFRTPDSEATDPDVCEACHCNPIGTIKAERNADSHGIIYESDELAPCDPISGQCRCKQGVDGRRCDRCLPGFGRYTLDGCVECLCDRCDHVTGACLPNYGDEELDNYFPGLRYVEDFDIYDTRHGFDMEPTYRNNFPSYEPSRVAAAHVSLKPKVECICKEREIEEITTACKKDFDYAIKARVLKIEDFGTHIHIHVSIKRVFKEGKIKLGRQKMILYPQSWLEMGCTCPVLLPNREYVIMGREDKNKKRLIVNLKSFVKQWTHGKHWIRYVIKLFRSKKCRY